MLNPDSELDNVRVFQPDTTLKEKLGPGGSFDRAVGPQILAAAEDVIAKSSDEILTGLQFELGLLQHAVDSLTVGALPEIALKPIVAAAFAIKSNAGLCGFPFASSLAKSLHLYCEMDAVRTVPLSEKTLQVVRAQATGLKAIFTNKITGDGGAVGAAILTELQKLSQSV